MVSMGGLAGQDMSSGRRVRKTLAQMTAEVIELNTEKGWRADTNTAGEYEALLHSEAAEMLEAFRDYRLRPMTREDGKPLDVASEMADILIRLLDTADILGLGLRVDRTLVDVPTSPIPAGVVTFGDQVSWLHKRICQLTPVTAGDAHPAEMILRTLVTLAGKYGYDMDAEYERKMAWNWTRPYQHGGRTISGDKVA